MAARRIVVVPHTHWDREWYQPFQSFRLSLVETLDALLDLLESDPAYQHFMLDGQMAVIDDYLEVRPENEERLRHLVAAGRLSIGPWYILMDEFLVSAETIIRDLQLGIERGAAFGGVMEVGYLPDMFGHVAQMPQILQQAGFEDAVIWRGVPAALDKTGFDWEGPDGSIVRVEALPAGYGNGAVLPDDAEALVRRAQDHAKEIDSFLLGDLLWMNGSDHLRPQPFLGRVLTEANALQDELEFTISSIPEYLERVPREGLARWRGELRSGARANLLMGVASNRIDVKQAAVLAERQLERRAEPLAALFGEPDTYPERLLDIAWRQMVLNSAHDSICACSVDEVIDAVLGRYAEARQIAAGVAARAVETIASSLTEPGTVAINLSPRERSGLVEAVVVGDELEVERVQVISERVGLPGSIVLDATTVATVLGMLQSPRIDNDAWITSVSVENDDEGVHLTVGIGPEENPEINISRSKDRLSALLAARPDAPVFVSLDQPRIRRILARSQAVPGLGWRSLSPAALEHPASASNGQEGIRLGNSLVEVLIDPSSGTFALDGLPGYGRLVDVGDLGDSYNYSPPATDSLIDAPLEVELTVTEQGPVRASAQVRARYRWPDHIDGGSQRRVGEHELVVTTTISVHADERVVRVESSFVNPAKDHRLRVHLPLRQRATKSEAECAFTVVERGLEAEGRADELGLPTFPSKRFVRAGGLTVVHEGLVEYELVAVEDARAGELALTLLRSTGMLSRLGLANRPLPAGPLMAVEGLQLLGHTITARYALATGDVNPYAMADDVLLPLELTASLGGGHRPPKGCVLELSGAELSSLRRRSGQLELRIFNPSSTPSTALLPGRRGWLVDLRGRPVAAFEGRVELGPHRFATLQLSEER